jgi:hypothetical protein
MKISILTHPLGANYGGILQAFALCSYLQKQGHEVIVLNRNSNLTFIKRLMKVIMVALHHPRYNHPRYKHLTRFVKKHIPYSRPFYTSVQMTNFVQKNNVQAAIVGSDQVWRTSFAMSYGFDYFLAFVPAGVKRLSYAASFGLSKWEYTEEQTRKIQQFVKGFDAISVREDEGIVFCQKYLNVKADHVLDPTMLLNAEDYASVTSPRIVLEDYVFVYWLGSIEEKQKAITEIKINNKKLIDISLRECKSLIPIEDWLSYIKYADRIVTDSFHGCVFSILFRKQFSCCTNDSGGNGRLKSLFTILGIDPAAKSIDYKTIEEQLKVQRNKSYIFIKRALQ